VLNIICSYYFARTTRLQSGSYAVPSNASLLIPFGRTMTLVLTQSVNEMSTRDI